MKNLTPFSFLLFSFPLAAQEAPPVAPTKPHSFEFHGKTLTDPYFWIKDKKNPETIKYIEAENAFRETATKHLKPFADKLYQEALSHIKQTDLDVPVRDGGYWYYSRTVEDKQYPFHCRKKGTLESPEEILLDVNAMADGKKFFSARPLGPSDDGSLFAFMTDTTGFREYYLSIKDLATGKLLEDRLVKATDFSWSGDGKTVFYVIEDAAKRPHKLFRHTIGEPKEKDELIYEEKDELYRLSINRTRDKKYLVRASHSSTTSEAAVLAADKPRGEFGFISPRHDGVEYSVDHRDGTFHIRTNRDNAVNFKWMTYPATNEDVLGGWKEFEPYNKSTFIEGIDLFRDFAVITEREGGVTYLRIHSFKTNASERLDLPESSRIVRLSRNPEFDAVSIRFMYMSLVTPSTVYEQNVATKERKLLKRTEVPGGFDPANYVSERVEATAADGVKVPISLVYKKGLPKDGKAPCLLTGYGSYGASSDPFFDPSRLVLLDRGVVFAIAHIRGGSDLGRQWYLDGKLMNKKNTFTDFIACADHLVKEKFCARDRLAIEGASAGGLLIGAVINLRPDVCKAAHLGVPFVDVVSSMLDESLPLTVQEFLEWGNPKESPAGKYMLEYSPYDNLEKKNYPSIIVTTSLNDSQVLFHEPVKYVAKLRTLKTDKNPLFLKCNMEAGHGGASGRYDSLKERAYVKAFLLDQIGIRD